MSNDELFDAVVRSLGWLIREGYITPTMTKSQVIHFAKLNIQSQKVTEQHVSLAIDYLDIQMSIERRQ